MKKSKYPANDSTTNDNVNAVFNALTGCTLDEAIKGICKGLLSICFKDHIENSVESVVDFPIETTCGVRTTLRFEYAAWITSTGETKQTQEDTDAKALPAAELNYYDQQDGGI